MDAPDRAGDDVAGWVSAQRYAELLRDGYLDWHARELAAQRADEASGMSKAAAQRVLRVDPTGMADLASRCAAESCGEVLRLAKLTGLRAMLAPPIDGEEPMFGCFLPDGTLFGRVEGVGAALKWLMAIRESAKIAACVSKPSARPLPTVGD